ncbi:YihY/virulence factor BrkB family protein [Candidatus Arthromitus sp. SFB-rat-Yit]|uniref:YihY/virulence factor BrkB family protein n=1 Tax=Candidatus Arthromitus sp. SFB-rat-Yit TaxID=1041504 RepID=UPI001FA799C7|nr:YihY/virulence factor BrkB family protein [Candidatus Arthromitus sp. SFB-rat-Yit]
MIKKMDDDELIALSSQLSYSFVLAFFPFLIFLMTVIGFLRLDSQQVLIFLQTLLPDEIYLLIHNIVKFVIDSREGSLLSLSLFLSIWSSSAGFRAIMRGLNKAYDVVDTRSYIVKIILSIIYTIGLVLLIVLMLILVVFGGIIGDLFVKFFVDYVDVNIVLKSWYLIRYTFIITLMVTVFAVIYYYVPVVKEKKLRWVLPGAIFTTIGWIVISIGFTYYVNNLYNFSTLYGSIGTVIVLMIWLFLTSMIILLGGEINAILTNKNLEILKFNNTKKILN